MPAYLIVEVYNHDTGWLAAYRDNVPQIVAAFGGRYVARTLHAVAIEGDDALPDTLAILEFPSIEAAKAMLAAPEYQPYRQARIAGATTRMLAIG